ncbi:MULTISPECIES: signal peptidase I [unclassified Streptomyces]|uniref:signal peptidase I n=1 Tax=unclassified Streptomyces TaxID=2593676 RepID=UPI003800268A
MSTGTRTGTRTTTGGTRGTGGEGGGRAGGILSGLAVALGSVLFLGGFVWGAILYQPYTVPTGSMTPTVDAGDRILAQRIDGSDVRRGDIVVFNDSLWGDVPMVKRVVAVGGDKVACCDKQGRLTVNGKPIDEPYLLDPKAPASPTGFTATVPQGNLFMMGDNRATSEDSRVRLTDSDDGSVPRSAVSARADAIAWPAGRAGMLERPTAFAGLSGDGPSAPGPLKAVVAAVVGGAVLIFCGAAYGPVARLAGRRRTAR